MAGSIHLKIKGVEGRNETKGFEDSIPLDGYRYDFEQNITSGSRGGRQVEGRGKWKPFVVFKAPDKSSPKLAHICAAGKLLDRVEIIVTRSNQENEVVRRFILERVYISTFRANRNSEESEERRVDVEEISFDFGKIKWELTPDDKEGQLQAPLVNGWDRDANTDFS